MWGEPGVSHLPSFLGYHFPEIKHQKRSRLRGRSKCGFGHLKLREPLRHARGGAKEAAGTLRRKGDQRQEGEVTCK